MAPSAQPKPARLLLCGFEAFNGERVNPAWTVAERLAGASLDGVRIDALCLPCVFGEALEVLDGALAAGPTPVLIVALGQAAGRSDITPERVAINLDDARIPDNAGRQPVDEAIVPGGPPAYFSTLPLKAIVHALIEAGVPAAVSNTAGTFVCNHVFYGLMHRLATRPDLVGVRGGFVHLPALPAQARRHLGMPSLGQATQTKAVRLLLRTALRTREDRIEPGGQLH